MGTAEGGHKALLLVQDSKIIIAVFVATACHVKLCAGAYDTLRMNYRVLYAVEEFVWNP